MRDLDIIPEELIEFFNEEHDNPYLYLKIDSDDIDDLVKCVTKAFRQCYVSDVFLKERADALEEDLGGDEESRKLSIIASKLPDPGSTMSGDFGEILTFLYHASIERPKELIGPKKWSLKEVRTKPAPKSDVVLFSLPDWPEASEDDIVYCSEVKAKATNGTSKPIASAIVDCEKDRTSRLADTLIWLKERAMERELGSVEISHLDRFIKAVDHPQAQYQFNAVAVISSDLVDNELTTAPDQPDSEYRLIVISVPELKDTYTKVFNEAKQSL